MRRSHSFLFAVVILAMALMFGGKSAEHTAIRAVVWQCVKTLLRPLGIH
jgi:hypothetical protein